MPAIHCFTLPARLEREVCNFFKSLIPGAPKTMKEKRDELMLAITVQNLTYGQEIKKRREKGAKELFARADGVIPS